MRYDSIQMLRGLAAMSVVLLHSGSVVGTGLWHIPFFSDFGWLGVQLFFVISGFIIADTIERSDTASQYLARRYLRVFPLYGAVTLVALAITIAIGSDIFTNGRTDSGAPLKEVSELYLLKSFLILPQDPWPFFMVGWSLEYEVVFYALFGIAYFSMGRAAAIGIVAVASLVGVFAPEQSAVLFGSNFVYFLCGCICREIYRAGKAENSRVLLAIFVLSFAAALSMLYGAISIPWPLSRLTWIISFSALLLLFLSQEERLRKLAFSQHLVMLGNISFALYLVHWLVFPVVRFSLGQLVSNAWTAEALRVGAIALAIYLSWGAWKYFENPVNAAIKQRLSGSLKSRRPAAMQP